MMFIRQLANSVRFPMVIEVFVSNWIIHILNIYIISFKFERNSCYLRKFSKNKKRTIFFGQVKVIKKSLNKEINGISDIVGQTVWTKENV